MKTGSGCSFQVPAPWGMPRGIGAPLTPARARLLLARPVLEVKHCIYTREAAVPEASLPRLRPGRCDQVFPRQP